MNRLDLGAFSVSLAVKDLAVSRAFYEMLGFTVTGGGGGYLMLRQGAAFIGLFQGMFEGNILTFNPGLRVKDGDTDDPLRDWRVSDFTDIRDIQQLLKAGEMELISGVDEADNRNGPASLMLTDPDGNVILIDQFFPRPGTEQATAVHEDGSCEQSPDRQVSDGQ